MPPSGGKLKILRNYRLTRSNLTEVDLNETDTEEYDGNDVIDYVTDDYAAEYETDDYEAEVVIEEDLAEDPLPVESEPELVVPDVADVVEPVDTGAAAPAGGGTFDDSISCDWYENYGHYESTPSTAYKCGEERSFICEHPRNDFTFIKCGASSQWPFRPSSA